ncbi:MAG: hypothetical protein ACOH1O_08760 [Flavobacterium sp.]
MKLYIFIAIGLFISCSKLSDKNVNGTYVRIGDKTIDSLTLTNDYKYNRKITRKLDRKILYSRTSTWSFNKKNRGIKFLNFYISNSEDFTNSNLAKKHYEDGEFGVNTFIENNLFNVLYFELNNDIIYKKVD